MFGAMRKDCSIVSLGLALLVLLAVGVPGLLAQSTTKGVMKAKLLCAQRVLDGIATEDFALISTNAARLARLSQSAAWQARQTPEYQRLTADFLRQAEALAKAARRQNIEAATLAYFQLTMSCVNCHKALRGANPASFPGPLRGQRLE